jgi:CheY-like chemotaxis protein
LYAEHSDEIKLVLLDYFMPCMNGDEVFECLRRINPDVRVILVSGSDKAVAKRMLADGLRAFLSKPFTPEELLYVMHEEINTDLRCHAETFAN